MASVIEKTIRKTVGKGLGKVAEFNRHRLPALDKPHPFLTGIHKPLREEFTLTDLKVEGAIPDSLDGRYLRIGPNPITDPDPRAHHWFIGDGMSHGIRLRDGKAEWYRNRWVRSNAVSKALGEPPAPGVRRQFSDNANTNIIGINGRTFAIVEAGGGPIELNDELETVQHNPFDGTLKGSYSAHPHLDPLTGEMHSICYDAMAGDNVWHVVVDQNAKVIRELPIPVQDGPSIHDCQITENYVLVFDLPATLSMKMMLAGYTIPFHWNADHPARVGLLPRTGTADDIIWCDVDPCYVYHPANAFETEDGKVIVDVVAHDSMYARSTLGPDSKHSAFERWTIDPATRKTDRAMFHDCKQEFPRYDERLTCKPYRYVYSVGLAAEDHVEMTVGDTRLFKHDLESGTTVEHDFGANRHPGEFVFVPRSDAAAEDEGWLMGLVVDMNDEHSELVILNADDFGGEPQAIVQIPHRIPPGFHGNWVPGQPAKRGTAGTS